MERQRPLCRHKEHIREENQHERRKTPGFLAPEWLFRDVELEEEEQTLKVMGPLWLLQSGQQKQEQERE